MCFWRARNFYHNSLNNAVALVWTDPTLHSRVKTIKHHQTIAIRALKTNQLDQFRGLFWPRKLGAQSKARNLWKSNCIFLFQAGLCWALSSNYSNCTSCPGCKSSSCTWRSFGLLRCSVAKLSTEPSSWSCSAKKPRQM